MKFQDVEARLPNGFHDAKLKSTSIDYVERVLKIQMELLVGTPDSEDPEEYRNATLSVTGLLFCAVDPPDVRYPFAEGHSPVWVSGDDQWPKKLDGLLSSLRANIPGFTYQRFFAVDWNSFIYVAGRDVELIWG